MLRLPIWSAKVRTKQDDDEPADAISFDSEAMSKHALTFLETESVKSCKRLWTSDGSTERLCAVCRDDARSGLSYTRAISDTSVQSCQKTDQFSETSFDHRFHLFCDSPPASFHCRDVEGYCGQFSDRQHRFRVFFVFFLDRLQQ